MKQVILVVGDQNPTNYVSLDGSVNCTNTDGRGLDDFSAVGLLEGQYPVTCAGDGINKCYFINNGTEFATMNKKRYDCEGIMISSSVLWVTGGSDGSPYHSDTEYVTLSGVSAGKVEKSLKGSLDFLSSPSPSVKIQIMGGKVCLRRKGKTLLGIVNKLLNTSSNVLLLHLSRP